MILHDAGDFRRREWNGKNGEWTIKYKGPMGIECQNDSVDQEHIHEYAVTIFRNLISIISLQKRCTFVLTSANPSNH